ncbi:hypothetical protein FRZ67_22445 [Panacibacter ginsenosidivorans]|uniref:Uncharacterized protein n=1 Tax=Panacibacter ginsenosidivorans TaxID=1813871 RepID=A0A5B8VFZ1_9BACT|nr:hypothetical protein [Panacibacter ginsenosidivorans]QEC69922.1 hypothetical protein FRZ67_22445 [Panacibacter ginsenosidivorans]
MKNFQVSLILFFLVALFSCKKEAINSSQQSATNSNELATVASDSKWQGAFLSYNGNPMSRVIKDKFFIKNGYARIYDSSIKISPFNLYHTQFRLVIPLSIRIKGDSLNFEIGLKNPINGSPFAATVGREIDVYIKGETNDAFIANTSTSDVSPGSQEYALMRVGRTLINNVAELQYNYEDYNTFILQTFNHGLVAYRNDTYVKGLAYYNEPLIGRLKEIGIIFQGSGFIDYIKLYNSANSKLLMSEDFNTDGQSTITWY